MDLNQTGTPTVSEGSSPGASTILASDHRLCSSPRGSRLQFADGFSTWSITITSSGAFAGLIFKPICSWIAV